MDVVALPAGKRAALKFKEAAPLKDAGWGHA
jgi:hypothetical protein